MPTFTTNLAIEKPVNGQQVNTWGTTVNENMDIFDRVMSQVGSIALSSTSKTLTTSTAGVISEGHYGTIKFTGSPGGTCTVTIDPNTIQRIYTIINATDQTVTMTQGSGGNVSITAGETKVIYCDGAGAGAEVVDVFASLDVGALSIGGTAVSANANDLNILAGGAAAGVSATEFQYLNGVTSAIQTQLDAKQASDADLTAIAALAKTDGNFIVGNGSTWVAESGSTVRTSLGLGSIATQDANAVAITGGTATVTTLTTTGAATFGAEIVETVYALSGTTPALNPANGTIQTWTLTGNSSPTDSLASGESILLMIDDGSAYTITAWPTMTWVNNAGAEPTLATTGYTVIALWKVSSTLYGALVGDGS